MVSATLNNFYSCGRGNLQSVAPLKCGRRYSTFETPDTEQYLDFLVRCEFQWSLKVSRSFCKIWWKQNHRHSMCNGLPTSTISLSFIPVKKSIHQLELPRLSTDHQASIPLISWRCAISMSILTRKLVKVFHSKITLCCSYGDILSSTIWSNEGRAAIHFPYCLNV